MAFNLVAMILMDILMSQIMNRTWHSKNADHFYLFPEEEIDLNKYSLPTIFNFYLLLNDMIPLDLAVTITWSKMFYVHLIKNDLELIHKEKSIESGAI